MKITVIGPWGGYPKVNEASSGYLVEHNGFKLLVDCGSGVLSKMQKIVQPEELDAVILSHYHPDHIADIGVLQHARLIQGFLQEKPPTLPVYAHHENEAEFSKLNYRDIMKGVAYDPNEALEVGPFKITFLKTVHPAPCYAMRFEVDGNAFVYTADTSFKDEFVPFSKNAQLLLCECNFYAHQDGKSAGHMNSFDAGKLANDANVAHLVLTHLPHYGKIEQLKEEAQTHYSGKITLASYGLSFQL